MIQQTDPPAFHKINELSVTGSIPVKVSERGSPFFSLLNDRQE